MVTLNLPPLPNVGTLCPHRFFGLVLLWLFLTPVHRLDL
jgi:hypothetical protein